MVRLAPHVLLVLAISFVIPHPRVLAQLVNPPVTVYTPDGKLELVKLEGKEHPELIPEHLLWRTAFNILAHAKTARDPELLRHIREDQGLKQLTPQESEVLFREAAKQADRDQICRKEIDEQFEQLSAHDPPLKPDDFTKEQVALVVDCRQRDLDAGERVMNALSPEGQSTLSAWLAIERTHISTAVPAKDYRYFVLPR